MLRFIHLCILTIYMIFGLLDGKVKHKNLKFQNHSLERPARIVEPVFNEVRSNHNRPSRVVNHRSRDLTLINSTLVDSSKNGYGMLTGTPSPLAYDLDGGWVMAYRQWQGIDGGSGYLGLAKSVDGQNWYIEEKINDTYPEDQVDPNLPTANGQPGARYPSAIFSNNSDVRAAAVWNEYTTPAYGGGSYGGVPMYIYDQNPITNTTFNLSSMMHLNNGCLDLNTAQGEVCNPPDLWNGNVQLVNGFDGNSTLLAVYETWADGDIYGAKYMIRSTSFNNGYISLADPYFLHRDASD